MKKIGVVMPWYGEDIPGGAEKEARDIVHHLQDAGIDVEILTTCVKEFQSDWNVNYYKHGTTVEAGITVRRFHVRKRDIGSFDRVNYKLMTGQQINAEEEEIFVRESINSIDLYRYMEACCNEYEFFIFIPYMFGTTYYGVQVCPQKSIMIPCFHDESYVHLDVFREAYSKVLCMVFNAEAEKRLAERLFDLSSVETRVMGIGMDTSWQSHGRRFREKYHIQEPFLLYAGRKDAGKNVDTLVRYFNEYKLRNLNNLKLVLIGGGKIQIPMDIQNEVRDLGFLPQQDKYDAYHAAELLCQPSKNESFSLVIMESWIAGRPVLVNEECQVTKDFVIEADGGLYFNNYFEFEDCVNYILLHEDASRKMGENGRSYVKSKFDWDIIIRKYITLFQYLMEHASSIDTYNQMLNRKTIMESDDSMDQCLQEFRNNINEADQVKKVDDIGIATKLHPSWLVILCKKIIFKAAKWMILPNQNRQTHFNGKIVNSVNLLEASQRENIQRLKNEIEADIRVLRNEMETRQQSIEKDIHSRIDDLNSSDEQMASQLESQRKRIILLEKKVDILKKENDDYSQIIRNLQEDSVSLRKENDYFKNRLNVCCDLDLLKDSTIDYLAFENKMRGSRSAIIESQRPYVSYFKINGGGIVLDLGCGRGEFLELMYDYGIAAKGIDLYQPFVNYCSERGFDVEHNDALTYLNGCQDSSVSGIFMGQVVEHLSTDYLVALIRMAYKKMKPGCYFILETPNPEVLATYRNFYIDAEHCRPVHYLYLKEMFEKTGFECVERFNNQFADYPFKLKEIKGEQIENLEEFNSGIRAANELIFGCRDYTLIARK